MVDNDVTRTQIGCGYCKFEKSCKKHDPKVNKAKQGCERFTHYTK